jgi:hypothetical protein
MSPFQAILAGTQLASHRVDRRYRPRRMGRNDYIYLARTTGIMAAAMTARPA